MKMGVQVVTDRTGCWSQDAGSRYPAGHWCLSGWEVVTTGNATHRFLYASTNKALLCVNPDRAALLIDNYTLQFI